jgi:hypothetical protein
MLTSAAGFWPPLLPEASNIFVSKARVPSGFHCLVAGWSSLDRREGGNTIVLFVS